MSEGAHCLQPIVMCWVSCLVSNVLGCLAAGHCPVPLVVGGLAWGLVWILAGGVGCQIEELVGLCLVRNVWGEVGNCVE